MAERHVTEAFAVRDAIRTVIARLAHTIDFRRWADVRALLADRVTTDYTSLSGGEVQEQSGDDLAGQWRRVLSPLDATQHLVGPIEVRLDGARATAECHVRGYHVKRGAPGGDEWTVAAQWVMQLIERGGEWRISGIALRTLYQAGNRQLLSGSE